MQKLLADDLKTAVFRGCRQVELLKKIDRSYKIRNRMSPELYWNRNRAMIQSDNIEY